MPSSNYRVQAIIESYRLMKDAAERAGLWANIRAKRARGERPAKPGEKDYPDRKQWKKLTQEKKAAPDMAWSRSAGGIPEMANVYDAVSAQIPKMQQAAYDFGGKAYNFLSNLKKTPQAAPQNTAGNTTSLGGNPYLVGK